MVIKSIMVIYIISLIVVYSKKQLTINRTESNTVKKFKRQGVTCDSTLELLGCDIGHPLSFSRREENRFRAKYVPDENCDIVQTVFDWYVYFANKSDLQLNDYFYKDIFIIKPYTIGTGEHAINLFIKEIHRDSTVTAVGSDPCIFAIRPEIPIPQITGGSEVTANSDENFYINGRESIDVNVAPGQRGNLEFKWTCRVSGVTTNFCDNDIGSGSTTTIPAVQAIQGATYTVTLSVKTLETDWQSTTQVINFQDNIVAIEIKCLKNCPPVAQKTNRNEHVILQAVCIKRCEGLNRNIYDWSIDIPGFDYAASTKSGRNTDIFHINENVLQVGNRYKVNVALRGIPGGSSIDIDVHVPPTLDSCSITPTTGTALITDFFVRCQHPPGNYIFEIYNIQENGELIIEQGIRLEDLNFTLGPGSNVKVKILDNYRFSAEKLLSVMVTPFLQTTGTDEDLDKDIMNKYFDASSKFSLQQSMKTKTYEKVLQVADNMADEMGKILLAGKATIAKKYCTKILDILNNVPMDTTMRARQLAALAAKITEAFSSKPDPEIAVLGTRLCKVSADKMLKRLKSKRFPESFLEETRATTKILSKCSQAAAEPNLDALKPGVNPPVIVTPFPVLDLPVIFEDYPDYVDDQNSSKAMLKFEEASSNLIKICFTNSKMLAVKMSVQEETKFMQFSFFNLTSTLKIGRNLGNSIESQGVTLVPSKNLAKSGSIAHIAMCTSTRDIFWWVKREKLFSPIAIINFNLNNRPIREFKDPFLLSFETESNIIAQVKNHENMSPKRLDGGIPEIEYDFEKMSMHRINSLKGQSFVIEFQDLDRETILDVVVADLHKPSFKEFREKSREINSLNFELYISNKKDYDSWYYLIVLPSPKMHSSSINYNFSVYTLSCFRWAHRDAKWEFACAATEGSSKLLIKCECYHASILTAMLVNNKIRLEKTLPEELELETQASYIIITSVVIIFFLYCIFFTWFSVNPTKGDFKEAIYFLGDVPSFYRYGYVIIVKTGNKSNAGTTSNVSIKIYGTKSQSKEHVLNYPDPEKKFLQRNQEDWFFVGTRYYLGDVEKIDLWFDSIGYRPAWFCTEIEIIDIQQNKYWLFKINKWFEILKNEQILHTAEPVKPNTVKNKKVMASNLMNKISNSFRGPHMWNLIKEEEQVITRMKRLHVVYSIFLTTYAMGLYLYGCPKLENSDSLSYTLSYRIDKYVILFTMACFLITYAIHFPIVWFFRYPKRDIFGKYQKVFNKYPVSTDYLCWSFLIINIVSSMLVLIILGFWMPYITGLLWLTSIIVSLLVYIFIMENITRVIINFTTKQRTRVQNIFEHIKSSLVTVEKQRAMLYKKFGTVILRSYFRHLYKPLDPIKIKEQKYWALIKEKLWEIVEDIIMISLYVTLLYLVILMDRDVMTYLSHLEVKELIKGIHTRSVLLEEIQHRKEFENYINNTLIVAMQSLQWYGKYITKNPGMTIDNTNKYLGIARLRQHRTYNVTCRADFINAKSCYPPYFWHSESKNFSEGWVVDELSNRFARLDPVWDYTSQWQAGSVNYVGLFASYTGGGYIANLGRTMQNSITNFNYLIRNNWIDHLSRSIFIEFLLYNPCNNLFNSVNIKFEMSATGYLDQELNVHTAKLLFIKEETGSMVWIIMSSFIVMLLVLIIKLTHRLIRKGKLLLKDIWHVVDIVIILMNLVCLGLYITRSKVVSVFLSRVEKARNNEFVNYFHLMYTERTLTIVAAILVFLATLRLWKLMRFLLIIKVVEKTLLLSAQPLICLFLCQLIFVLACAFCGILKYGDYSYDFRGFFRTISNLFLISLNLYKDFDFEAIKSGIGYFYYSAFMIITLGIYTIYIAIITISYAEAKFYYSDEEEYNVVNYVKEQCEYGIELFKVKWRNFRLRGGNEKELLNQKVCPKADEFRYANCVTLPSSKMDGMTYVTKCILRNMKTGRELRITDQDVHLIKYTIVNLFKEESEEKQIFFISNIEGERVKFVDDRVMLRIEDIVRAFLVTDDDRLEKERRRKLYRKIIESHEQRMRDIDDDLNVLLDVLSVVNIDV